jgi:hypothetical protein
MVTMRNIVELMGADGSYDASGMMTVGGQDGNKGKEQLYFKG